MSLQIPGEEGGSTGMEVIAGNEDLLTLILLRLPVRSLLRFKSVSKHWLSLISNPQFCIFKSKRCCKHISGILLNPRCMVDDKFEFVPLDHDCPAPFQRLDFLDDMDEWELEAIQCCNGLLLCRILSLESPSFREQDHRVSETKYYVINPTTKQHTTVSFPVPESVDKGLALNYVALAFDPRKSPHFKLISLFWYGCDHCVQIYSSETGLMSQFSSLFHIMASFLTAEGFYWNGAINWINWYGGDGLYLNVDEERFGILPMPPAPHDEYGMCHRRICYYGESSDRLYLVQPDTSSSTQIDVYELDVYELNREFSGWFVRFHVDLRPMFKSFPTKSAFSILAIVDRDDGENPFIVFGRPGKAIRFDLKDGVFTQICDFSGVDDEGGLPLYNWTESIQFIESLHPL